MIRAALGKYGRVVRARMRQKQGAVDSGEAFGVGPKALAEQLVDGMAAQR